MSLTDDLKAGKLETGFYYVKLFKERAVIPFLYNGCTKEWGDLHDSRIEEVLAPCDYEELKNLQESCKNLEANYKLLQQKQTKDMFEGQSIVEEFGDYEALRQELQLYKSLAENGQSAIDSNKRLAKKIESLRQLLAECKNYLETMIELGADDKTTTNLLSRINEVLK